jgi:hypothetical protein
MPNLAGLIVIALVALVGYHTSTYGRRGRRWGRM